MVHIKRVELSHFKSFGGTTQVPLLPGFTVVSGPNGSGKSNILDALLFALGLASSKGMRAERLPDLVNHKQAGGRSTVEVSVSVTFDLEGVEEETLRELARWQATVESESEESEESEEPEEVAPLREWMVTRRLRVTKSGNYSSTFYINGEVCTAGDLHQQLNRLRIYPEGYNVVLQGDVTRIITMNGRERREIIDELAGVAEFDRQIGKVRQTLAEVKEREERCHIIEEELTRSLEKLAADRAKAEKYQALKEKIQDKQRWEAVLSWRSLRAQTERLQGQIKKGETEAAQLEQQLAAASQEIEVKTEELARLNARVKALGEEEQLSVASQLATQKAKRAQLQQRQGELATTAAETETAIARTDTEIANYQQESETLQQQQHQLETETLTELEQQRREAETALETARERATEIASASQAWIERQTALSKQINDLQRQLNPQRTEQAQLAERDRALAQKILDLQQQQQATTLALNSQEQSDTQVNPTAARERIQNLAARLAALESDRNLEQETQKRLEIEQRQKQRQLDKLEATAQAQRESSGTYASQTILQANLPGICGLVAQLGRVEPSYQLALETSAGGRLGNIVVEDDRAAAQAIELLKQRRAGRATFLPLNKMRALQVPSGTALRYARGFVDYAVNLVSCEPRYRNIFAYVFGSTAVFETLEMARPHLGKVRIVTLDGDILESSGAMTGGSRQASRSTLHFGKAESGESAELQELRERIAEIEVIVKRCEENIREKIDAIAQLSETLTELRQQEREQQLRGEQEQKDRDRLSQQQASLATQLERSQSEVTALQSRLQELTGQIPQQEARLEELQGQLAQLEAEQTHSEWLTMQQEIKQREGAVQEREAAVREAQAQVQRLADGRVRLQEKGQEARERREGERVRALQITEQQGETRDRLAELETEIQTTETQLAQLTAKLGEVKVERDRAETDLQGKKSDRQQQLWQLEKLQQSQQERRQTLAERQEQLDNQKAELIATNRWELANSDESPHPQLPLSEQLERLQTEIRNGQKRLEAMEPVNMLALQEYERTQERLQELTEKVNTLADERTELLLRIETFTTLRRRAFTEAFDAVNENFQQIFATLSDGDGYLELEHSEDPFSGGLNLVAHPKGKPVQRLSSMSGGEKSLTALSFIFSLQRYRPSPFYAFDEVDMFLDGANVERLSKMIKQQAEGAQFIVVSLRRPMIEASQRTIGVTQARGAHTQVLGIKL